MSTLVSPNISWAEKYRPKTIDDLIFPNNQWKNTIHQWLQDKKINGNIALFGCGGFGKSSLAKILINTFIKSPADFKLIKSRSVQEIDTIGEFIRSVPLESPMKIILIEEADRLSSAAQNELKDKYTEKFQDHCSIIITTNYPQLLDEFLLQRFIYKIDFSSLDQNLIFHRLLYILEQEQCQVNESELKDWIEKNANNGLRNLINYLQLSAIQNNNLIVFEDSVNFHDLETKIIGLCQSIIGNFLNCKDLKERKIAYVNPIKSEIIGPQWVEFVQTITNNQQIDYRMILEKLEESISFLPIKFILTNYLETLKQKQYPHLHIMACLSEILKCITEITI